MSDDVKLPEDDIIDLDGDIELPKSDDDFDLDKFLAENASEDVADVDVSLPQGDVDLDGLLGDKNQGNEEASNSFDLSTVSASENDEEAEVAAEPVEAVAADEGAEPDAEIEVEPEPIDGMNEQAAPQAFSDVSADAEVEPMAEVEAEFEPVDDNKAAEPDSEIVAEPEVESEPAPEVETAPEEEAGNMPEVEPEAASAAEPAPEYESVAEEPAQTEEDVVNDDKSKGWAFEGIETSNTEEDEASAMDEGESHRLEDDAPADVEIEPEETSGLEPQEEPVSSVEDAFEAKAEDEAGGWSAPEANVGAESAYGLEEAKGYARWYSGNYDDKAFEVDKQSVSGVLDGDDEHKIIHVNVGYDTYGWQVEFANGVVMNLRDVREYQLKNGALPAEDGAIVYGDMRMEFHHIEKITLYESVRYFTYMPN